MATIMVASLEIFSTYDLLIDFVEPFEELTSFLFELNQAFLSSGLSSGSHELDKDGYGQVFTTWIGPLRQFFEFPFSLWSLEVREGLTNDLVTCSLELIHKIYLSK